jgi:hypothetical protein
MRLRAKRRCSADPRQEADEGARRKEAIGRCAPEIRMNSLRNPTLAMT